jgi:hypothetical protein
MAASTAPAPKPKGIAAASNQANEGAKAKPVRAKPVRPLLTVTTTPACRRCSTQPLANPESAEQPVTTTVINPAASMGWANPARMAGQATPNTPSGRPRLMKAR